MYNARIEGLLTRSSEISPFISSSLKVDSQFSNCSRGPRHKEQLRNIAQNVPKITKSISQLAQMYSKESDLPPGSLQYVAGSACKL